MLYSILFVIIVVVTRLAHFLVQTDLAEYHKLGLDISELEKKIMSEMIRPERALLYLVPGRLVGNSIFHNFFLFVVKEVVSLPFYLDLAA